MSVNSLCSPQTPHLSEKALNRGCGTTAVLKEDPIHTYMCVLLFLSTCRQRMKFLAGLCKPAAFWQNHV